MYYLNDNISLDSEVYNDHDVKSHREYCKRRSLNIPNVMSVPTARLHTFINVCHDLEVIIKGFNDNWYKSDFRFTIEYFDSTYTKVKSIITLLEMIEIAIEVTSYNLGIREGLHDTNRYMYYTDDVVINPGEPIEMCSFTELLIYDLCNDRPSALCKEIITYDMGTRPKNILLILKLLYLFSNAFPFSAVKLFYERYFPRIVSQVESEHEQLAGLINRMYSNRMRPPVS